MKPLARWCESDLGAFRGETMRASRSPMPQEPTMVDA